MVAGIVLVLFAAPAADACRYSVREVGFVDLDRGSYRLNVYVNDETPEETLAALRRATVLRLRESCIEAEFINVDRDSQHSGLAHLTDTGVATFPLAVLVSPEERARPMALAGEGVDFDAAIEALVDSPIRRKLLDAMVDAYCVVLFVEGAQDEVNAKARTAAAQAVEVMTRNLGSVEKPTDKPPLLLELPHADQAAEEWLIWSLGLEPGPQTDPGIAILFGRGRRLGATLRGDRVDAGELTRIMAYIGASCECGLDRSWMQGVMVPLRWDRPVRERLTRHLGFDPDSPLVRMEVNQILAQGAVAGSGLRFDDPFFGYREFSTAAVVAEDTDEQEATAAGASQAGVAVLSQETVLDDAAVPAPPQTDAPATHERGGGLPVLAWVLAAVALVNVLVVLGLVVRARWNAS
ncbi:MAG TPA: hypothetical protein PKI11_15755 [Candidatus Hydrogenedentes bacterium]|nr:hypothetical protein [Candidatus Hydrogenedentota bacterium]